MIRWTKQFYKTIFSTIFHRRKFSFIHKRDYTRNKRIARYQPQKKKIIKKEYKNITLTVKNLKKYRYFYYPQSACFAIAKEIKKKKKINYCEQNLERHEIARIKIRIGKEGCEQ